MNEGQADDGFAGSAGGVGTDAFGAEMVGVDQVGCAVVVSGEMTASSIDFAAVPGAGRRKLGDFVAGKIIEIVDRAGRSGLANALAAGIVDVGSGGAVVHRGDAVLGIVSIAVGAVAEKIARGVVRVAVHAVVGAAEAEHHRVRAVLVPAIAQAVVVIGIDLGAAVFVRAHETIEIVISIRPIAVDAIGDGGEAQTGVIRTGFGDAASERDGEDGARSVEVGGDINRPRDEAKYRAPKSSSPTRYRVLCR